MSDENITISPWAWCADRYYCAAEILHHELSKAEEKAQTKGGKLEQATLNVFMVSFPRNYLYGLTIEMILKAIIAGKDHLRNFDHHDIPKLFEEAKQRRQYYPKPLGIIEDKGLLKKIKEIIMWAGRYPFPKRAKKVVSWPSQFATDEIARIRKFIKSYFEKREQIGY